MPGYFIISLDFELMWGVREKRTIESYGKVVKNVHQIIPSLLELASTYNVSYTFCAVGFLFHSSKEQLQKSIPVKLPTYQRSQLNPYGDYIDKLGKDETVDPYHYGKSLIDKIKLQKQHEIGTHTYSHFFALEPGQTKEQFKSDMEMAFSVAKNSDVQLKSIVFPRNQVNKEYLNVLADLGIRSYRGTEMSWLYKPRNTESKSLLYSLIRVVRRILRLMDAYIPLSGHNCYHRGEFKKLNGLWNIPSSRLLRPYNKKLAFIEFLKLARIKRDMTHAAMNNKAYHLWWHPHNFGKDVQKNLNMLEEILLHYKDLNQKYGFESITMNNMVSFLDKV